MARIDLPGIKMCSANQTPCRQNRILKRPEHIKGHPSCQVIEIVTRHYHLPGRTMRQAY
jgi:hypothetical protein